MTQRHTPTHWLLLALLVAMWGSAFTLMRVIAAEMPPLSAVAARLVIACAVLYPVMRLQGHRLPTCQFTGPSPTAQLWRAMTVVAVLGNAFPFVLIMWAQQRVDSGLASIFIASAPLTTLVAAHFMLPSERMTPLRAMGFVTGFVGVCVLIGPQAFGAMSGNTFWQSLALIVAAMSYGLSIIFARKAPDADPLVTGTLITIIAAVILVPLALVIEPPWTLSRPSMTAMIALLALGVFSTSLGNIIFFVLTRRAGATFVAIANYFLPAWAVVLGALFFAEPVTLIALAGMALILGGVGLSELKTRSDVGTSRGV